MSERHLLSTRRSTTTRKQSCSPTSVVVSSPQKPARKSPVARIGFTRGHLFTCKYLPYVQSVAVRSILLDVRAEDEKPLAPLEMKDEIVPIKKAAQPNSQLSPIRLLPTEILSRIFYYAASGDSAKDYAFNSIPPIVAVCKQWRMIAHATSLWDTVPLTAVRSWLMTLSPARPTNNERLEAWLALSRAPLSIYERAGVTPKLADWSALFDTPRPWKHFRCSSPGLVWRFLSTSIDISNMETLHLRTSTDYSFPSNWEMVFPKLKDISLAGLGTPSALSRFKAPKIYSVTLSNAHLYKRHIEHLSKNFQTVAELRLHRVRVDFFSINGAINSPFRHLEKYEGSEWVESRLLSLFQSSPLLRDLTIISPSFYIDDLEGASLQSVTSLSLRLSKRLMSEAMTLSLLRAVPQISELRLTSTPKDVYTDASLALIPLESQNPVLICPKLRLLLLQGILIPDPDLLREASLRRSGHDSFGAGNRDVDSSLPTVLLVTINDCRGAQDVSEADYERLCEALGE